ncbi:MAG: helix-turn-helix domain-containing protein [bacterium]|jgi:excisionase family DNA binding protein|nr:helix-turn-helix domain-containing protein [bacterium]
MSFSPKEMAQAVGVSESTIKRWVDQGKILAQKSEGGHRKIDGMEVLRLIRTQSLTLHDPGVLGLSDIASLVEEGLYTHLDPHRYYQYLHTGQAQKARGLLQYWYLCGHLVSQICDGPIAQAMERLGELWLHHEEGISQEHQATDVCIQAVYALRQLFEIPEAAPCAVGGAPAGDPYFLPSLCAAAVLESEGFQVINLGPNTPVETLLYAIKRHHPQLVWLSMTSRLNNKDLEDGITQLLTCAEEVGFVLITGGRSSERVKTIHHRHFYVGSSMKELHAYAKALALHHRGNNDSLPLFP